MSHCGRLFALLFTSVFAVNVAYGASLGSASLKAGPPTRQSVTDVWLGGFGVWSNPIHWTNGVPCVDCDVYIATGNDDVSLDVSSTVMSLSIGASSGNSTLDGTYGQKLNVFGTVSVNPSGMLFLANGGSLTSGDLQNSGFIGLFTPRDHINAQSFTNYDSGIFNIDFGHGDVGNVVNYGRVDVHNGGASLNVGGDFRNYGLAEITTRAQLNVGGTLSNFLNSTMNLSGPATGLAADTLVNYGTMNVLGSTVSTTTLINGGTIESLASKFQIGTGKAANPGYYQYGDGIFVEGIGAGSYGVLTIDGPASLGGELDIVLENGFVPLAGSMYRFLNFVPGQLSGTFAGIQDPYFNDGTEMWTIQYDSQGGFVQLVAVPSPEPGSMLLLSTGLLAVGRLRRYIL